jgi:hypothetical protein
MSASLFPRLSFNFLFWSLCCCCCSTSTKSVCLDALPSWLIAFHTEATASLASTRCLRCKSLSVVLLNGSPSRVKGQDKKQGVWGLDFSSFQISSLVIHHWSCRNVADALLKYGLHIQFTSIHSRSWGPQHTCSSSLKLRNYEVFLSVIIDQIFDRRAVFHKGMLFPARLDNSQRKWGLVRVMHPHRPIGKGLAIISQFNGNRY